LRQEDKEVDGFELEQAEERKRENELIEDDDEELYDLDGKPESYAERGDRTSVVAGAMHKILEREHLVIDELELDRRELRALEALKTAVDGRDQQLNGFVFAEDRRALLEQALAVLQPEIADLEKLGGAPFETLVKEVAELRSKLNVLEDAQEEIEAHAHVAAKAEAGDTDDKPEPTDDQSLDGPERAIEKPASSLSGPERKAEPKPPTSLTGPEIKDAPKPPTTLGDPKEIAAAAQPWWKR
jgi:hypothetical protein